MAKKKLDDEFETDNETVNEPDLEGLIKMHKDGEELHVHPTTVKEHKTVGWKLA